MARPPGFDRQQVLQAAERQFRKAGYAGTSLDDICSVTGLGRGSLYAAFGDKHGLFMTALGDYCGRAETDMAESLAGPDEGALDRLRAYLAGLAGRSCPEADLGCMALRFAVELGDGDPEAAARIQRSFDEQRNALLECVRAAQRAGDLDSSVAAEDIACLLMTITRGMEVVAQAGVGATALEGAARQAYAALPLTARAKRREKARAS